MSGDQIRPPVRPHLPPIAWAATAAMLCARVWLLAVWRCHLSSVGAPYLIGLTGTVIGLGTAGALSVTAHRIGYSWSAAVRRRTLLSVALLLGLAAGLASAMVGSAQWSGGVHQLDMLNAGRAPIARLDADAVPTVRGWRGYALVVAPGNRAVPVMVFGDAEQENGPPLAGDHIRLSRLTPLAPAERFAFEKGAVASARAKGTVAVGDGPVTRYRAFVRSRIPADANFPSALLSGLLLGDRSAARVSGLEGAFRRAGVSHILAVSGTHLAVVVGMVAFLSRTLRLHRSARLAVALFVAGSFTIATGAQLSTVRALVMLGLVSWASLSTRRPDPIAGVALAVLAMVVLDPFNALSVALLLSASAVLGIATLYRLLRYYVRRSVPRIPEGVSSAVGVTMAAQLATLPVSVLTFGTVPAYGLAANLAVVPLASLALLVGQIAIAVSTVSDWVGTAVMGIAGHLASMSCTTAAAFAAVPGAEVTIPDAVRPLVAIGATALAVVLFCVWPLGKSSVITPPAARSPRRGFAAVATAGATVLLLGAVLVWGLVRAPGSPHGTVEFLDVGQGDAVLVRSAGSTALIDAGSDAGLLEGHLTLRGITKIDALVLTHDHADHASGADPALRRLVSQQMFVAAGAETSSVYERLTAKSGHQIVGLHSGDSLRVGALRIEVVAPSTPVADPSANESCVILYITAAQSHDEPQSHPGRAPPAGPGRAGGRGVLVGGDAEAPETLRAAREHGITNVGVLKVGHHGSAGSVTADLLEQLLPQYAVFSVGKDNGYGHPDGTVMQLLRDQGVKTWRTDLDGSITVKL